MKNTIGGHISFEIRSPDGDLHSVRTYCDDDSEHEYHAFEKFQENHNLETGRYEIHCDEFDISWEVDVIVTIEVGCFRQNPQSKH
jgi:hypothetical protein